MTTTTAGDRPLLLPHAAFAAIVGHAYDAYPLEACGLLVGNGSRVTRFVPCTNVAASAKVYTVDPLEHLRAERAAEAEGLEIIGVVHSHTHSEPYPSPTDVAQAPEPAWHYVIVSFRQGPPVMRSYRIVDGAITEEPVALVDG